ncbi:MAG: TRAP transporter substrate-binding protein [Betaproteobacteria bacterium]|jgi:TRAP-type mannitol/chloroaromatic compound transport system substrate-binding protein|nr:TRAP transporter substrate-binding protein [Betaproteobacteria bacterium]
MQRRAFLKKAGLGAAAGAIAAPAIVRAQPQIQWRLASSFPKNLDTLFGAGEILSRRVAEGTDGKFQIRVFAAGEIVPGLQVLDAVQNGTVQCGHTAPYYYIGKDPAFAFATALPFGLNARQQNAWMYHGGGMQLLAELFKDYGCVQFPSGNTGVQMGGWYRKEIKSVADLKGLKMRVAGIAGQVLARLGVVAQQIAGGELYQALERGTIDAAEWVGPYDDEKLGLQKVAKFYYYPGWWEGGPQLSTIVNIKQWESLPKAYRSVFESACAEANVSMLAHYDAKNPEALKKLVAGGAQLRQFPKPIMEAAHKAAFEIYDEMAAKSAHFKRIYAQWLRFRADQFLWFRVAEMSYDSFTFTATRPAAKK